MKRECSQREPFIEVGKFRAQVLHESVVTTEDSRLALCSLCSESPEGPSHEGVLEPRLEARLTDFAARSQVLVEVQLKSLTLSDCPILHPFVCCLTSRKYLQQTVTHSSS